MWFEFWFFSNEKMKLFFFVLPIFLLSFFSDIKPFQALKSCCRPFPCLASVFALHGLFLAFWQRPTSQASLFFSIEKLFFLISDFLFFWFVVKTFSSLLKMHLWSYFFDVFNFCMWCDFFQMKKKKGANAPFLWKFNWKNFMMYYITF